MTDGHGDDLYRYGGRIRSNFSSNIYSHADHGNLMRHLSGYGEMLSRYPHPSAYDGEEAIACWAGLPAENVMMGNGATEIIYLTAQLHMGGKSLIVAPTFREYQDACRIHRHDIRFIAESEFEEVADFSGYDIVWLCNPNNPTGHCFDKDRLLHKIRNNADVLFVVDQAYADYCMEPVIECREGVACGNVLLLHSLTKRFAVPGLRIGYCLGAAEIISRLRDLKMPWTVNALAIEATRYLIAHEDDYSLDRDTLHSEIRRLAEMLTVEHVEVSPTSCNFILCRLEKGSSRALKEYMAEKEGILIRDASNFETLDDRYFRIAAQSAVENDEFIEAFRRWTEYMR